LVAAFVGLLVLAARELGIIDFGDGESESSGGNRPKLQRSVASNIGVRTGGATVGERTGGPFAVFAAGQADEKPVDGHIRYCHERISQLEMKSRAEDFYRLMNSRRTIRDYSSDPVPRAVIVRFFASVGGSDLGCFIVVLFTVTCLSCFFSATWCLGCALPLHPLLTCVRVPAVTLPS
jgi:hypothetical protein